MKVALSVEHIDPARGGAETYMHWLAGRLARDGHDVHVFARDLPSALPAGITGHLVTPRGSTQAARARDYCAKSAAAIDRCTFDVIHATNRTLTMDVYQPHGGALRGSMDANLAMLGPAARHVQRLRWRLSPRRRAFLAIEREVFALDDVKIVAVSAMVRDHIRHFYDVPAERITVVHNGVDLDRFTPVACAERRKSARARHGVGERDIVILLMAHNPRLKGLKELIAAVARARQRGAPLALLAVGRFHTGPFRRLARRLGCEGAVTFRGPIDDSLDAYAGADIYAQPTYYDPCSLTVLEALACGLPVITTRHNGASELLTHGRDGFVLDRPGDMDGLAEAILALCEADLRCDVGTAARALAEQHSTERNYRGILAVYERAADGKWK